MITLLLIYFFSLTQYVITHILFRVAIIVLCLITLMNFLRLSKVLAMGNKLMEILLWNSEAATRMCSEKSRKATNAHAKEIISVKT